MLGGQRQRLRFALAMLPKPDVLILDEPTTGLDVEARRHFWQVMGEEADAGRTVIFATHYIEEADSFARRVVLVSGGQLVADGPINEVRASVSGSSRVEPCPPPISPEPPLSSSPPGLSLLRYRCHRREPPS